ncbi:MAG: Nif3-like dinuclear metal center hexameric protein [Pseudomonadota bacterium]
MRKVSEIEQFLCEMSPLALAESWDNVGLLIGRRSASVSKVITCLTLSPDVAEEACAAGVGLIVTHHPFPFKPSSKYTDATVEGRIFLRLIESGIAVFSSHTAFDGASEGINELILRGLGFTEMEPITPREGLSGGLGRMTRGDLAVDQILNDLKAFLSLKHISVVRAKPKVKKVGVVCGSGGDFISTAHAKGIDCFITGEATFHHSLLARSLGITLILVGHFLSERFAMEVMAQRIGIKFPGLSVFASQVESDPVSLV